MCVEGWQCVCVCGGVAMCVCADVRRAVYRPSFGVVDAGRWLSVIAAIRRLAHLSFIRRLVIVVAVVRRATQRPSQGS